MEAKRFARCIRWNLKGDGLTQGVGCVQYGNGTLRLTTRQTYQLHGVLKEDLKTVFSSVIKNMGTTLGACGDVNRYPPFTSPSESSLH